MQKKGAKKDGVDLKVGNWEDEWTKTGWGVWEKGPGLGKQDMKL